MNREDLLNVFLDTQKCSDEETITAIENFISNCNACKMCMSEKNFSEHERCMSYYNQSNTMFRLANITNEIMCLALAKQIDPKYAEEEKALSAAIYLSDGCGRHGPCFCRCPCRSS